MYVSYNLTTQAQRPGALDAAIANPGVMPGSLQRMVRRLANHTGVPHPSKSQTRYLQAVTIQVTHWSKISGETEVCCVVPSTRQL